MALNYYHWVFPGLINMGFYQKTFNRSSYGTTFNTGSYGTKLPWVYTIDLLLLFIMLLFQFDNSMALNYHWVFRDLINMGFYQTTFNRSSYETTFNTGSYGTKLLWVYIIDLLLLFIILLFQFDNSMALNYHWFFPGLINMVFYQTTLYRNSYGTTSNTGSYGTKLPWVFTRLN